LTIPISSLYRTPGCAFELKKTRKLLIEKNIGKKFDIEFLDPVRAKSVRFCGKISKKANFCLPEYIHKHMVDNDFFEFISRFFVFKKGKNYIIVNTRLIQAKLAG